MRIGIIGSNERAAAIGRLFMGGGHDVTLGDARSAEAAQQTAARIGAECETPYNQAMTCDLLVFAFPRPDVDRTLAALGAHPDGVVLDAREGAPAAPHRGAELLAHKLDSHRVVRGLVLLPQRGASVPICGDDPEAKALVEAAFQSSGCAADDRGPLSTAPELEAPSASQAA